MLLEGHVFVLCAVSADACFTNKTTVSTSKTSGKESPTAEGVPVEP